MKRLIALKTLAAWVLCASGVGLPPKWQPDWATEKWDLRLTEPGAVREMIGKTWCGHVQGMCATTNSFYFSFHNQILKTDWLGRLQRWVPVERHGGDICHWNGKLYTGVALRPKTSADRKCACVCVYDAETLKLLKMKRLEWVSGGDAITCLNGVLYFGIGYKPGDTTGRMVRFVKLDAETLEQIGEPIVVDLGVESSDGTQNLTTDGTYLYVNVYSPDETANMPCFFVLDQNFNIVGRYVFGWRQGMDVVPGGKDGAVRFVYCTTANWMSQKEHPLLPVQAVVQFADLKDGKFSDITRYIIFRKPIER